jgi:hypothetical protein
MTANKTKKSRKSNECVRRGEVQSRAENIYPPKNRKRNNRIYFKFSQVKSFSLEMKYEVI